MDTHSRYILEIHRTLNNDKKFRFIITIFASLTRATTRVRFNSSGRPIWSQPATWSQPPIKGRWRPARGERDIEYYELINRRKA